ncbi:spermatogenesis-associated protein 31D3-like [Rhinolophus sinicus]|uniref:spermatogenesis-associated protein 31D3-like n=1 Tax=Rhinolophus sinicus TaxID=89399 RepID=UPI003D79A6C3
MESFVPPVSCSLLCQHHATMHFCQLFHPDPLCQVSNNVTTEVNCLLFPEALDDATRCDSLPPEPFRPLESASPTDHSPPQPL